MIQGPLARISIRSRLPFLPATALFALLVLLQPRISRAAVAGSLTALAPAASQKIDFVRDIRPILVEHCYSCHGPEKQKSDLRWDNKASLTKIGEHGPVLIPGNSAGSRVIRLVAGLDPDTVMPAKGERLTAQQIGLLRAWIDQGAKWADTVSTSSD